MKKEEIGAHHPAKEKSTLTILIIVLALFIVLPILCITLKMGCACMGFGAGTRGRRDGVSQYDRRNMKIMRLVAHFKDGSVRDVLSLVDYETLRQSGLVLRFEKIEVK